LVVIVPSYYIYFYCFGVAVKTTFSSSTASCKEYAKRRQMNRNYSEKS